MTGETKKEPIFLRFRALWAAAAVFVLLLSIAAFIYRDDLFASFMDPGEPFQTYKPPAAPNYDSVGAWISLPGDETRPSQDRGDADIFVVTPTTYWGGSDWVAPQDNAAVKARTERIIAPNYVSPYKLGGRVFAPKYRHASLYSFMTNRDDAREAQDFAYSDVARAFDFFLMRNPPERPIVLMGHGQGGLHVQRLLAEYFQGDRKARLAAAYIIDHPTPIALFDGPLSQTPPCETDIQTGCVVSFGAFTPNQTVAAQRFVSGTLAFAGDRLFRVGDKPILCINPLLWAQSEDYAPARLHAGAVAAEGLGPNDFPAPISKQFGARCEDGVLAIDKPKSRSFRRRAQFGGRFKTAPFNLFYEDLRLNIIARTEALIMTGTIPRLAPALDDLEEVDILDSPVTPTDNRR